MNLQNIAAQHRASVGLVFSKYGINAPVTPESIQSAVIVYKEQFIQDVERAVDMNSYDDGDKADPTSKVTKGQKITDTLRNILTIAGGAFGAYQAGKQLTQGNQMQPLQTYVDPEKEKQKKNMKIFIIGVSAVLVMVVLFVVITKVKDKKIK